MDCWIAGGIKYRRDKDARLLARIDIYIYRTETLSARRPSHLIIHSKYNEILILIILR